MGARVSFHLMGVQVFPFLFPQNQWVSNFSTKSMGVQFSSPIQWVSKFKAKFKVSKSSHGCPSLILQV
jgi:hypothetical protein